MLCSAGYFARQRYCSGFLGRRVSSRMRGQGKFPRSSLGNGGARNTTLAPFSVYHTFCEESPLLTSPLELQ
jgi:hypothetical protein